MPFIKAQKIVRDEQGKIISGSAAIVDTVYVPDGKYHSKQIIREKLGSIIEFSEDKRNGIFLSPTRGIVEYNADSDTFKVLERDDSRLNKEILFPEPQIHTVFGDAYLLLAFLRNKQMFDVFNEVFKSNSDKQRLICHLCHSILKDGSRISCNDFVTKSFVSYFTKDVPIDSLRSDYQFFHLMGSDNVKMNFFSEYIELMKREHPKFGEACYVDSTPLPNDSSDNPFNALCSHGLSGSEVQMRLVLVIDEETGLPIWFEIIPGNMLDIKTINTITDDVHNNLGIRITSLVLDAGYVSKDLIKARHVDDDDDPFQRVIARMPARKGYPHRALYNENRKMFDNGKYMFVRENHTYFGIMREIDLFEWKEYAYVYVDKDNALNGFKSYVTKNEEEFESLKDKDKTWKSVCSGYFVLISNQKKSPKDMLNQYFGRCSIESVIKTSKSYLGLLPIAKWNNDTVRGKILFDIINTIIYLLMRKKTTKAELSMSDLIGSTQSLMCYRSGDNVIVEYPNKQAKRCFDSFRIRIPAKVNINQMKKDLGL